MLLSAAESVPSHLENISQRGPLGFTELRRLKKGLLTYIIVLHVTPFSKDQCIDAAAKMHVLFTLCRQLYLKITVKHSLLCLSEDWAVCTIYIALVI